MRPPGSAELDPFYTCQAKEQNDHTYFIKGDVDSFFERENVASGMVNMVVPFSAIGKAGEIVINDETSSEMSVSYDRRRLASANGTKQVLVVRVSDELSSDNRLKISQSETKMYFDIFKDENNLRKVYKRCSGKKLNIQPATGDGVKRGVITISASRDICNESYNSVANSIKTELKYKNIQRTHTMFVMPDCVNWEGGEAWADINGSYTFIPTKNASYPMVQVHEMGHNFGHRHSAKNGSSYGDDTGYMGNQVPWTDAGAKMCFNAAKLWHFGWSEEYHWTNKPENFGLEKHLVGIGETSNRGYLMSNDHKSIIRLESLSYYNDDLFLNYNHKYGPNSEVAGDENKVVITEQEGRSSSSTWKAALDAGQTYTQSGWGSNGETLVVKNCGFTKSMWGLEPKVASARIIVYLQGKTYKSCDGSSNDNGNNGNNGNSGNNDNNGNNGNNGNNDNNGNIGNNGNNGNNGQCQDYPGFHDYFGEDYDCDWYGQASYLCNSNGSDIPNEDGLIANQACCTCGGGYR